MNNGRWRWWREEKEETPPPPPPPLPVPVPVPEVAATTTTTGVTVQGPPQTLPTVSGYPDAASEPNLHIGEDREEDILVKEKSGEI